MQYWLSFFKWYLHQILYNWRGVTEHNEDCSGFVLLGNHYLLMWLSHERDVDTFLKWLNQESHCYWHLEWWFYIIIHIIQWKTPDSLHRMLILMKDSRKSKWNSRFPSKKVESCGSRWVIWPIESHRSLVPVPFVYRLPGQWKNPCSLSQFAVPLC